MKPFVPLLSKSVFSRRTLLGLCAGSLCVLAGLSGRPAAAQDAFVSQCGTPTPSTRAVNYPGVSNIVLSNNLARPTGKAQYANGQLLYVSGRVTDKNCVPVANAIIDLWQANPFGQYRWASRDELLNPEPLFAGSGRAVTDNMGRYNFITLFPGSVGSGAPHIQLRITHPDFKPLDTSMYFRGDRRNAADSRYKANKSDAQGQLLSTVTTAADGNSLNAEFNITLPGRNPFRSY